MVIPADRLPKLALPPEDRVLGVTGHRLNRVPADGVGELADRVSAAMRAVTRAIADAPAGLRVLTGLADGVDRIAAQAALAQGSPIAAALPYAAERFEQDYPEPSAIAEFRALFAACAPAVALDGAGFDQAFGPYSGYAAAGAVIARAAHVLLAVWDGQAPRGPGGTAEVCAIAIECGAPVIWLPLAPGAAPRLIEPEANLSTVSAEARSALRAAFAVTRRPPEMRVAEA